MKTSRLFSSIGVALVALLSLSGCMSFTFDVNINSDQTASVSVSIGYDKEAFSNLYSSQGGEAPKNICDAIKKGQDKTDESKDVTITWSETDTECVQKMTPNKVGHFDEHGIKYENGKSSDNATSGFQIVKKGDSAVVTFASSEFTSSVGADGSADSDSDSPSMDWQNIITKFKLNVTFPGTISKVNFDGKLSNGNHTVTWDLKAMKKSAEAGEKLEAVGGLASSFSFLPIILIGLLVLLVAAAVVVFLVLRSKKAGRAGVASVQVPAAEVGAQSAPGTAAGGAVAAEASAVAATAVAEAANTSSTVASSPANPVVPAVPAVPAEQAAPVAPGAPAPTTAKAPRAPKAPAPTGSIPKTPKTPKAPKPPKAP
ncbi:MAG: hypothetical protein KF844_04380 [Cryobacterium sp.]|nr:hypothetical protein [Cryobacterium sp.]